MESPRTLALGLAGLAALVTVSCSGGAASATCVTGKTVECACTSGARGAQTCTAAGIFTPCSCSSEPATQPTTAATEDLSCDGVTDHIVGVLKKAAVARGEDVSEIDVGGIRAGVLEMCQSINWPVVARRCVLDASSEPAIDECMYSVAGMEFLQEAKTTEAREFLKKLYDGARVYYMDSPHSPSGMPTPPQFPSVSVGPTPPLGECCAQGGKCEPRAGYWDNDTWVALQFSVDDPNYYSYSYIVTDPYTEFTVRANGDLDCDGIYSTFEMFGIINSMYPDGPAGSASLARVRELE